TQNMSDQLTLFQESNAPTLSLSDRLVKILAWLENEGEWKEKGVVLSHTQLPWLIATNQTFLCGKMLKEHTPQTMAQIFGRLSKPLPTLMVIDSNSNCLIQ